MDLDIGAKLILDTGDEQATNVIHVHVRQHNVGDRREIDAGTLHSFDQLSGSRQVQIGVGSQACIDEDGLAAATHHDGIERPIESVWRQEHVVHPGSTGFGVGMADLTWWLEAEALHR